MLKSAVRLKKNHILKAPGSGNRRGTEAGAGFTLLELILSIAILSAVLVTIYSALSMGARTWDKGERDIEKVQRMRVVMDLLSREIKAAYPYRVTPSELDTHREYFAFDGEADSLSFVSCAPLQGGTGKLSWLTFWVEEGEGLVVVERDALRSDIFEERETIDRDEMVVLDASVSGIEFAYYRAEEHEIDREAEEETAWEEKWVGEEEESLPQAVNVSVTFVEKAAREGDEDDSYARELVIPLMITAADKSGPQEPAVPEDLMGGESNMGMMGDDGAGGSFTDAGRGKARDTKSGGSSSVNKWDKKVNLRDARKVNRRSK